MGRWGRAARRAAREAQAKTRVPHRRPTRTPEEQRAYDLKRNFNLSIRQYDALLVAQGGVCAVCKEACPSGRRLAVDHDHATGAVRGLLCARCNPMIGYAQDDPSRLAAATAYLLRARS